MENKCGIQERLTIHIYDEKGNLIDTREPYNGSLLQRIKKALGLTRCTNDIVLNGGLEDVAAFIADRYGYIEIGSDATAPSANDTGVIAPLLSRSEASTTIATTFYDNDTVRFSAIFEPEYQITVREAGICKDASSGEGDITFARETFAAFTANAGAAFTLTWDVVVMR